MTPLERAAQAVRDEIATPHGDGTYILNEGFREDDYFRDVARAVIEAIRQPSMVMIAAGDEIIQSAIYNKTVAETDIVWPSIIDSLLAEE